MKAFRQRSAPLALVTCITFGASLLPAGHARADGLPEAKHAVQATGLGRTPSLSPSTAPTEEQAEGPPSSVERHLTTATAVKAAAGQAVATQQDRVKGMPT